MSVHLYHWNLKGLRRLLVVRILLLSITSSAESLGWLEVSRKEVRLVRSVEVWVSESGTFDLLCSHLGVSVNLMMYLL